MNLPIQEPVTVEHDTGNGLPIYFASLTSIHNHLVPDHLPRTCSAPFANSTSSDEYLFSKTPSQSTLPAPPCARH